MSIGGEIRHYGVQARLQKSLPFPFIKGRRRGIRNAELF